MALLSGACNTVIPHLLEMKFWNLFFLTFRKIVLVFLRAKLRMGEGRRAGRTEGNCWFVCMKFKLGREATILN